MPLTTRSKIVEQAHKRWLFAQSSENDQRMAELDDLRFDANDQWPQEIKDARKGNAAMGLPPQPCLTINRLTGPLSQVTNAERQADFGVRIKPRGSAASKKAAEVFQGLIRRIQTDSRAALARNWAAERAAKCGRGFYRILPTYEHEPREMGPDAGPEVYDQTLTIQRILNQANVFMDPAAQQPDWSDAEWAIITETLTLDKYEARYGTKTKLSDLSLDEWTTVGTTYPGWVSTDDKGTKTIRVADYYYVETTTAARIAEIRKGDDRKYVNLDHEDYGGKPPDGYEIHGDVREVKKRTVKWCVINALEAIKTYDWRGKYIPIVVVLGKEKNVDGQRSYEGIIRSAKDAQRSYNYMASKEAYAIGLTPLSPVVIAAGQIKGFEKQWNTANTHPWSALIYHETSNGGHLVPPPQRAPFQADTQAITIAKAGAADDIRVTTGIQQASLGELDPQHQSGRAIRELKQQSELGTSDYVDNLRLAVEFEGILLADLAPHYYDRPGRIATIMSLEGDEDLVMLNQPFVKGQNGVPQPVDQQQPPPQMPQGQQPEHYDVTTLDQYSVVVEVGKAFSTRREEGVAMMSDLAQAAPQLVPVFADLWVGDMDFPSASKIAERLKKANPLARDEQNPQVDVQQLQAQLGAMQQQLQQLQPEAIKMQIAQLDAETKVKIAEINAASAGQVAATKANADQASAILAAEVKAAGLRLQHSDQVLDAQTRHADTLIQHAHAATEAGRDRAHDLVLAEHARQTASEQAAMQAQQTDGAA